MRQRPSLIAFLVTLTTLLGAITSFMAQLERQQHAQKADQRVAWDNFGEYTVPEIEQLKERVSLLEQKCKP
jgi:hypothetical protein